MAKKPQLTSLEEVAGENPKCAVCSKKASRQACKECGLTFCHKHAVAGTNPHLCFGRWSKTVEPERIQEH